MSESVIIEKPTASAISRRTLLTTASAAAAVAAAGASVAEEGKKDDHQAHDRPKNAALAESALDCVRTGEDCLEHCFAMFQHGDTSLAVCAGLVRELVIGCTALAQLAANDSRHVAALARVTRGICADCEKECRKHTRHKLCIVCADSCAECIKQCDAIASA